MQKLCMATAGLNVRTCQQCLYCRTFHSGLLFAPWEAKQSLHLKRGYASCVCEWSIHVVQELLFIVYDCKTFYYFLTLDLCLLDFCGVFLLMRETKVNGVN